MTEPELRNLLATVMLAIYIERKIEAGEPLESNLREKLAKILAAIDGNVPGFMAVWEEISAPSHPST